MKSLFIAVLAIFMAGSLSAQISAYNQAMNDGLILLDSAKSKNDYLELVNRFERISQAVPDMWEPLYYLAFSRLNLSYQEKDEVTADRIIDQADENIQKALLLNGDKSELHTLSAFASQCRINVNPSRGMTQSMVAKDLLDTAMKENSENPRAFYLMGMNIFYTPEGFGGGSRNALPLFQMAKEKFKAEAGRTGFLPKWGAGSNEQMIVQCNH